MTLGDLLSAVAGRAPFDVGATPAQADRASATVASVTSDSREVVRGSVFVALRGLKTDGAAFARDAITRLGGDEQLRGQGSCITLTL